MTPAPVAIRLTVNGVPVEATVPPRTHLADFLREHLLLTGTHLGCEHGVCGACTLLIDGAPARSCIAFAAACEGARVDTIEGLAEDEAIVRLRAAFTAEHALQCGYCTPGMLVTARDIVLRLPAADEARIRLELAGNLCRCTGYAGIVRAIARVLRESPAAPPAVAPAPHVAPVAAAAAAPLPPPGLVGPGGEALSQTLRIVAPPETVWQALQDPALIASCLPGARLTEARDGRIAGELLASLGPIQGRFTGAAELSYGPGRAGRIRGEGRDAASGTRLTAAAAFTLTPDGPSGSALALDVTYALRGPLAQFARGPVVRAFAAELAETVARNLSARLAGAPLPAATTPQLGLFRLLLRIVRRWWRGG